MDLPINAILDSTPVVDGDPVGRSREARTIVGHTFGEGPLRVSLIAGCHADEPAGPAMLRRLVGWLRALPADHPALRQWRWHIVPHVHPDGEAANAAWVGESPTAFDPAAYLAHVVRDDPGDDVEFGFPRSPDDGEARPENRAVADFLRPGGPYDLHVSFHGMAVSTGAYFLIEPLWVERTRPLRERLREEVTAEGWDLHEEDRRGAKGFWFIEPGFSTRPDSRAMRDFFLARNDVAAAAGFRPGSFEFVRDLGGDPLTLVSEPPMFLVGPAGRPIEISEDRLSPSLRQRAGQPHMRELLSREWIPVPLARQMDLQLRLLSAAMHLVGHMRR
jgi:hypothetical protein